MRGPRSGVPLDLRARRGELRLTPREVAAALGVHTATVLRWERGERLPGPDVIAALAGVLATDRAAVVAFFDAHRPPPRPGTRVRATGLRTLRHRRGWTAAHVAAGLGVPVATVFNWEAGRAGMPLELLPRLASLIGAPAGSVTPRELRALLAAHQPRRSRHSGPLQRARARRGLTQARLADHLGVSRHLVGAWERGRAPRLAHQRRLAEVLGTDVATVSAWFATTPPLGLRPAAWRPGDLPQVLRDLRAWSGLTQRDVARHCGRSTSAVRSWEAGRKVPPAAQRAALAALYRLPAGALDAAIPGRSRPTPVVRRTTRAAR
ncbi:MULTISPECIES: helix-turn-helix transcriptional regulator [unclassified Nocardioides]|uniref:helix-turn-helix transcriptional regulator n=1 Tax=unclassified Nocardioides TaxID=2615069 RepID=UPI0016453E3F|nr:MULTISPECIES: helix-turn-helix transcriptional regulator [unclassified Nocardioides]